MARKRNGTERWRQLKKHGFRGSLRVVGEWATRRRADQADRRALGLTPSARTIARSMTIGRGGLTKAETVTIAAVEGGVPRLTKSREIIAGFQTMIRKKKLADLDPWLGRARSSLVALFANSVMKDLAPVTAEAFQVPLAPTHRIPVRHRYGTQRRTPAPPPGRCSAPIHEPTISQPQPKRPPAC